MTARRPWFVFLGAFWPFLLGCVLLAGGLAAIVIGYLGVSGTVFVGLQMPYLVSGVALGLALCIVGTGLLVVQVLTRQTRLLRRVLAELEATPGELEATAGPVWPKSATAAGTNGDAPSATATPPGSVFVVRGGRWFHRRECSLLDGKRSTPLGPHEAEDRGLVPCRLCDPVVPAAT